MTVTIETIRDAAKLLEGEVNRTPAMRVRRLSQMTGAEVYLKLENLQVTGSFKVRGAGVKLASLTDDEKAKYTRKNLTPMACPKCNKKM